MGSWLMKLRKRGNDRIFGVILIALGLLSGWGIGLFFVLAREPLHFSMLLAPAGLVFLGLLVIFSDELERALKIEDEIQDFPNLIEDDLENLRAGKITPAHGMLVITLLTLLGLITSVILYRKWQIAWGGCLNVVVVSVLAGFLVGFIGISTAWFQQREKRFSWGIFLIPLIALALSSFLGIYYAEPEITRASDLPVSQGVDYRYADGSTRLDRVDGGGVLSIMDGSLDFDCDDEACLVLILVAIAIACIVASAFIPHFWVVATTILWVIMLLITLREWLCTDAQSIEVKPSDT